jgi:uncharacterized damage-inducible protein DinB
MDVNEQDRFPVGRFERSTKPLNGTVRKSLIELLERTPTVFRFLVESLSESQLERPYRAGGWTIRQVVHHMPDSHMNAFIRMKLALTETTPIIKTYEEARWAELPDVRATPVGVSLSLLEALHERWVALLRGLSEDDFRKTFAHPKLGPMSIDDTLALYAWHGRHHAAHIEVALGRTPISLV